MNIRYFMDKKRRKIKLELEDLEVQAFHMGRKVGYIQLDDDDLRGVHLFYMEVDNEYRNAGIATEMMKDIADMHGSDVNKPSFTIVGGSHVPSCDYYTSDGAVLIRSCISRGILADTEQSNDQLHHDEEWSGRENSCHELNQG